MTMSNYRSIIRAELNNNKEGKVASIPAKKYNRRSRAQAKQTRSYTTSGSTAKWNEAASIDVSTSYEDQEAAFWSSEDDDMMACFF